MKIDWPVTNAKLANILGIKPETLRAHVRNHNKELIEGEDYARINMGVPNAPTLMYAWTLAGAVKIAHYCKRSPKAKIFLQENNITPLHVNYIEGDLLEIIIRSFNGIYTCCKQYRIGRYRVDLFIKELGLVIECDEMGHSNRNQFDEFFREMILINEFGFSIIRFNPDEATFNIGDVINKIIKFGMGKLGQLENQVNGT